MKKTIIVLICIFLAIVVSIYNYYLSRQNEVATVQKFNKQYEQYFDRDIASGDVATIINMATDNNEKYGIAKNSRGIYTDDGKNSVKVLLKFVDVDTIYEMEDITRVGVDGFLQNFASSVFRVADYTYSKATNRISRIVIEETDIGNI